MEILWLQTDMPGTALNAKVCTPVKGGPEGWGANEGLGLASLWDLSHSLRLPAHLQPQPPLRPTASQAPDPLSRGKVRGEPLKTGRYTKAWLIVV